MPPRSLITERESLQNWIDEGARLATTKGEAYLVTVKISRSEPGRPNEGAWRAIRSAREIPTGIRYSVKRNIDDKIVFVSLDEETVENQQDTENKTSNQRETISIPANNRTFEEMEAQLGEKFEKTMKAGLAMLAMVDKLSEGTKKNLENAEKVQHQMEIASNAIASANTEQSKAVLYKNLGYAANRLVDFLQIVTTKDNSDAKKELSRFLLIKTLLRKNDIDIDSIQPSDLATVVQIMNDPRWKDIIEQYKAEELKANIDSMKDETQGENENED